MNPTDETTPLSRFRCPTNLLAVLLLALPFAGTAAEADRIGALQAKVVATNEAELCRHAVFDNEPKGLDTFASHDSKTQFSATDSILDIDIPEYPDRAAIVSSRSSKPTSRVSAQGERGHLELVGAAYKNTGFAPKEPAWFSIRSARTEDTFDRRKEPSFDLRSETTLVLEIESSTDLSGATALELELAESGKAGHFALPISVGPSNCRNAPCTHTVVARLGTNLPEIDPADLQLRVVSKDTASATVFTRGFKFTSLPFPKTHKVYGQIRFNYVHRYPDIAGSLGNPNYPQYAEVATMNASRPIRFAKIVLQDDCGHYIPEMTDANGHYSFDWTPVNCGLGKITVWSVVDKSPRHAAVGYWKHGPVDSVAGELTAPVLRS